jgi:hypothetical protein
MMIKLEKMIGSFSPQIPDFNYNTDRPILFHLKYQILIIIQTDPGWNKVF